MWKRRKKTGFEDIAMPTSELRDSLLPFVAAPRGMPPYAKQDAVEIVPGLMWTTVLVRGAHLDFLLPDAVGTLGGLEEVRAHGRRNLRRRPAPGHQAVEAVPGDADTTIVVCGTPDPFAAAYLADLDHLLAAVVGAGPRPHGVLVAVPYWRTILVHVLRNQGGLQALSRMADLTARMFDGAPERERLLPEVYFRAPDGGTERVSFTNGGPSNVVLDVRGRIRELYLVPQGLV